MNFDRYTIALFMSAIVVTAGLIVGYQCVVVPLQEQHIEADQLNYQETHTYYYPVGEVAYLDSDQDSEGQVYEYEADFGWNGEMDAVVRGATRYRSVQEAGIKEVLLEPSDEEDLVVISLELHNIDAHPLSENDAGFYISAFQPVYDSGEMSSEIAFFDGASNSTQVKNGYVFYLSPGEKAVYRVGFYIPRTYQDDDYALVVGNSGIEKYILQIPTPSVWKE